MYGLEKLFTIHVVRIPVFRRTIPVDHGSCTVDIRPRSGIATCSGIPVDRNTGKLTGSKIMTLPEFAINDHCSANTCTQCQNQSGVYIFHGSLPEFSQRRGFRIIEHTDGKQNMISERFREIYTVQITQCASSVKISCGRINSSGSADHQSLWIGIFNGFINLHQCPDKIVQAGGRCLCFSGD